MTSQFIPPRRPPKEVRRQQLIQMRDHYSQQGFACEMDIEALKVQTADDDNVDEQIRTLELKRDNMYKAAARMEEELTKYPAPKPEKKKQ